MSKRKISYIIGGICIAVCVAMAGIWFLNRNKVKDDAVTVDIRTDTVSAGENEESSWNTDVHGIAKAEGGYYYLQMKSKGMCLYFYDESVQRSIAVCSKAECNHGDVQCNALFSDIRISVIAGSLLSRKHLYDKSKKRNGCADKNPAGRQ